MNCKLGDLAIIIRAPKAPENVGRIVKVTEAFGEHKGRDYCDAHKPSETAVRPSREVPAC